MYTIKHTPEDFIVTEISTLKFAERGNHTYFTLKKKNYSHHKAIEAIASKLRIRPSDISYAGIKDKKAITEQTCSAPRISREAINTLNIIDIELCFKGYGAEPIHLGQLEGNEFKIVVRNLDSIPSIKSAFHNLFGEQRFSERNADIGKHIIKREFEQAARILSEEYPAMKPFIEAKNHLAALRKIPRKLLIFYIHAYQSKLWNKAAMMTKKDTLPIVGFGTTELDEATRTVLAEESLKPVDFIIREFPEISAEGSERTTWAEAKNLQIGNLENDEFFSGKKKVTLTFFLQKGSYATEFIRQNFI